MNILEETLEFFGIRKNTGSNRPINERPTNALAGPGTLETNANINSVEEQSKLENFRIKVIKWCQNTHLTIIIGYLVIAMVIYLVVRPIVMKISQFLVKFALLVIMLCLSGVLIMRIFFWQ